MAYHSQFDVLPVYYETLCYKSLRDDDSIEMLDTITHSRKADLGRVYGWSNSILEALGTKVLDKGSLDAASTIEAFRSLVIGKIDASLTAMKESR